MQHFFVSEKKDSIFLFDKENSHHLINVLRIKNHEKIICVYNGSFYECHVQIENKEVIANIINKLKDNNELIAHINLIYGLPKGEKLDLVLQKATELGVKEITLLNASRSIAKIEPNKLKNKYERFNKIVKNASEQSKRNIIPLINGPIDIQDIPLGDINLIAYEEESINNQATLYNLLNTNLNEKKINIVIGPEGGFNEEEVDYLVNKGYKRVSLGKRILRSETACLDLIAIIAFMAERG